MADSARQLPEEEGSERMRVQALTKLSNQWDETVEPLLKSAIKNDGAPRTDFLLRVYQEAVKTVSESRISLGEASELA
jgi:hypothetical protein